MPKLSSEELEQRKSRLSEEQYNVCFLAGTEPPFSGKYTHNKKNGMYKCVVCGNILFSSATKFDSQTGWPSFWDPENRANVKTSDDSSLGMHRTEVSCATCGAHLGHVFDDLPRLTAVKAGGPDPTGKRYCINSLALEFVPSDTP